MFTGNTIISPTLYQGREKVRQTGVDYHVYMLRIWKEQAQPNSPAAIRLTLEDTRTGVRVGFTDLEKLMAYLEEQIGQTSSNKE
jgi:hypothetical protein